MAQYEQTQPKLRKKNTDTTRDDQCPISTCRPVLMFYTPNQLLHPFQITRHFGFSRYI